MTTDRLVSRTDSAPSGTAVPAVPQPDGGQTMDDATIDVLVVLGVRLRGGGLPRRLINRLDLAAAHHRAAAAAGRAPVVIVTGGGAPGEPTEAAAMAEYLIGRGVPAAAVHREERARNTAENLSYSMALLDGLRSGDRTAGVDRVPGDTRDRTGGAGIATEGDTVGGTGRAPGGATIGSVTVVTSGYHVLRTRLLAARTPGLRERPVVVGGAVTPPAALPTALAREAVALLMVGRGCAGRSGEQDVRGSGRGEGAT